LIQRSFDVNHWTPNRWQAATLERSNLLEAPIRPVIERLREAMDQRDDRTPLEEWLARTVACPG